MRPLLVLFLLINSLPHPPANGQFISSSLPGKIKPPADYLFYLHGGVVTVLGNNAINQSVPEWGPYEYLNILDSLGQRGFMVISENRKEGVADTFYVNKICRQIDTLFKAGVKPEQVMVLGASAGSAIAIHVSGKMKNEKTRYVIMGGCWPDTYKDYQPVELYGHFLSIIEASDPHGTCKKIFEGRETLRSAQEITLHTGLSHGFIYKGHQEWIDPVVNWFHQKN
jgi:hypothetical protein